MPIEKYKTQLSAGVIALFALTLLTLLIIWIYFGKCRDKVRSLNSGNDKLNADLITCNNCEDACYKSYGEGDHFNTFGACMKTCCVNDPLDKGCKKISTCSSDCSGDNKEKCVSCCECKNACSVFATIKKLGDYTYDDCLRDICTVCKK